MTDVLKPDSPVIADPPGFGRSITMRDVARAAGVSQSTVSRVLSAPDSTNVPISEDTVLRVQEAARLLGYQPNLHARSLRGQRTQLIAMMVADIANPYYHVMVRKVQDVARKHGYDVLIANSDHDPELERHFIQGIMRRPVDGVVLTPYHLSAADISALIERTGVRVVLVGQHLSPPGVDRVFADDELATYDTARWLIKERGHSRIAYIAVPGTHPSKRRVAGLMRALGEAGLPMPAEYLETGDFDVESGESATERLLALPQPPTVVLACNDLMALGCITRAQQLGRSVPGDLAVVGFDNIPEAARVSPKLTTIAQYPAEMGDQLASALFDRLVSNNSGPGREVQVPCKLIIRESA